MQAYLRIFYCAILICSIAYASYLYNRTRKTEVANIILSSTKFTFNDGNNKINFYSISPKTIDLAYKKLEKGDIEILSSIIKDEKQDWGPINYKIIDFISAITGSSAHFLAKLNDSAKFAVYYSSVMILKRFGSEGFKELAKLHFLNQNQSAKFALLEILQNRQIDDKTKNAFKAQFLEELEKK